MAVEGCSGDLMQNCLHFVSAALFFQLNQTGILGPHCLVSGLEAFFFLNDAIWFIGFFCLCGYF